VRPLRTIKFAVVIARVHAKYPIPSCTMTGIIDFLELIRATFLKALAYLTDFMIRSPNAKLSEKIRIASPIHKSLLRGSGMHPLDLMNTERDC